MYSMCPVSNILRPIYANFIKRTPYVTTPRSKTNVRYMQTPQQARSRALLKRSVVCYCKKIQRLTSKLDDITKKNSVDIDTDLQKDLQLVVESDLENLHIHNDFSRVFWKQQVCKSFDNYIVITIL